MKLRHIQKYNKMKFEYIKQGKHDFAEYCQYMINILLRKLNYQ